MTDMPNDNLCEFCNHPKDKHAFDIVVSDRKIHCEVSCVVCFDSERLKRRKIK